MAPRIDEPAERLGTAYSRFDAEEIERDQLRSVKRILNLAPGVFASGTPEEGGITALSIRGNRPDHTLVLVDGVRVNTGMFTNAAPFLSYATPWNLESVEVVRGPLSPLFGSDAIAGVASVQTLRGQGTPGATLLFEAGSFDTFRGVVLSDGSLGPLDYSFHYAHEQTSNDRPHNDNRIDSGSLRLDWQANEVLALGMTLRTHRGELQDPSDLSWGGYFDPAHYKVTGESTALSVYAENQTTDLWRQRLTLGYYREAYTLGNPRVPFLFDGMEDYNSIAHNFSADWQHTIELGESHKITTGATLLQEVGHDNSFDNKSITNFAFYLQDQWQVMEGLTLTGGARWDHYQLSGDAVTYRLTGAYLIAPTHTKVRASVGTGFKAPGFYQLFSTSEFSLGRSDLKPEKSFGWDIGVDQYFLDDQIALSATYFQNDITDLIAWVPTGLYTGSYDNRDRAENHGIELSFTAKITDAWQARLAYTWTESYERTDGGPRIRSEYRPRNILSAETSYTFFGKLTLGGGVYFVGQQEALDWNIGERVDIGDYTLFRLHGRYEVCENFAVFARLENLANERYVSRIDYPGARRGIYGGLEVKF